MTLKPGYGNEIPQTRGRPSRPPGGGQPPPPPVDDTPPGGSTNPTPIAAPPVPQQGPSRTSVQSVPKDPLPVYYGTMYRVGAQIWNEQVQTDGSLVVLYLISHGPINSIANITIEEKPLSTFNMVVTTNYNTYTGTSSQTLDPILSAAYPSFTAAFPYVAYAVLKFPAPSASQPAPDWRRFLCDVQGMLVRDPRTDSTLVNRYYRDNPTLEIADYMTSPARVAADGQTYVYGAGLTDAKLDWAGTITTAANDCDVLLADGVTKRFTMGYGITSKQDWRRSVDAMRAHAQLLAPQYNNGIYQIMMDKSQAAAAVTLTDAGNTANVVTVSPMVVKGSAQCPTHVECDFINPAASYKDDTAFDDDPNIIAGAEVVLPPTKYKFGTIPYDQAKRLCKYLRKRLNKDASGTLYLLNDTGIQLLPGVRVPLTSVQYGFTAQDIIISKLRRVVDPRWAFEAGWELYDASVYDDTQASGGATSPAVPQSPYDISPEIINPLGAAAAATIYWAAPVLRSTTLYPTWTNNNMASFTSAKVNDGDTSATAFSLATAGDAWVSIDFGSAIAIREWWVYYSALDFANVIFPEYSDDNIAWTAILGFNDANGRPKLYTQASISLPGGITLRIDTVGDTVGAHRYWRERKTATTNNNTVVTELWPRTYTTAPFNFVKEYRLYKSASFIKQQLLKRLGNVATAASPIDLTGITFAGQGQTYVITTVNAAGVESNGHNCQLGT